MDPKIAAKIATGRVAVYARYSSDLQSENSIDDQARRARDTVSRCGGDPTRAVVFPDFAMSGTTMERPGLEALLRAVDEGRVDVILTEDVSRISRDIGDAATIFKRLQFAGVPLIGLSDGIDTSGKQGKLTYAFKSMMAEWYIDELRDRTLRGLEGRALAGLATGGVPFGFTTVPVTDERGRICHEIAIDPEAEKIVRRIFGLYLDGKSLTQIAHLLNREHVPSPRAGSKHKRMGWGSSTIRAMLYNDKYAGIWRFKERQWVKVPGTNKRRPKARAAEEVITLDRPELRIVHADLWDAVRARLDATKKQYTKDGKGKQSVRNRGNYVLSGILVCDVCGTTLTVYGGSTQRYYKCGTHRSKGTCPNDMTIREDIARKKILAMIRDALMTPEGIAHVRRKIAEHLRDYSKNLEQEIKDHRDRLARTEQRIKGLVGFIADGDRSESVVSGLRDLEAGAKAERAGIDRLVQDSREPLRLPSIDEVTRMVFDLEARAATDPLKTRAQLQRWHKSGVIRVRKRPDGVVEAWGDLLPLAILSESQEPKRSKHGDPGSPDHRATSFVAGAGLATSTTRSSSTIRTCTPHEAGPSRRRGGAVGFAQQTFLDSFSDDGCAAPAHSRRPTWQPPTCGRRAAPERPLKPRLRSWSLPACQLGTGRYPPPPARRGRWNANSKSTMRARQPGGRWSSEPYILLWKRAVLARLPP